MTTISNYLLPDKIQWTFQDAVERLLDNFGEISRDGRNYRIAKEAVFNSYDTMARSHEWRYYIRRHIFKTDAAYSTGTVVYDHTGGSAERIFTLTGGTWPTNAAFGYVKIGNDHWPLARRISSTIVQAREDKNPGADIASTTYQWYRSEYPYPVTTWRHGALVDAADRGALGHLSSGDSLDTLLSWNNGAAGQSQYFTVRGDGRYLNNLSFVFVPAPSAVRTYEYSEQAVGWPLTVEKISTGTVTVVAGSTTATFTSPLLTSDHIGCVLRTSGTAEEPTSIRGGLALDNPYQYQRVIQSVTNTTTAVLDSAITAGITAKRFTISSPIDVDAGPMLRAFWSLCEWEFCIRANRDSKLINEKERQWNRHLLLAQDADRRTQQIESGEYGGGESEFSLLGTVTGVPE
jgi:hypothetical protein